jgi:hypothetical protein
MIIKKHEEELDKGDDMWYQDLGLVSEKERKLENFQKRPITKILSSF